MMRVLGSLYFLTTAALVAADEMQTRVFPVNTELIGGRTFVRPNQPPSLSPMGYNEPREIFVATNPDNLSGPQAVRQSAKAVLLNEGITFPPGATASYNPQTGLLVVHNTPENLKHTQLFLDSFDRDLPVNLSFMVTVVEAPGEMIRQANIAVANKPDCGSNLELLLQASRRPDSRIRVVGETFLESQSGQRSTSKSVREHVRPSGMTSIPGKGTGIDFKGMEAGLRFNVEPTANGGEIAVTLTLDVNSRPPTQHKVAISDPKTGQTLNFPATESWDASFHTSLACKAGQTRLIGITKPQGVDDEDMLWAAFLHVGRHIIPSTALAADLVQYPEENKGLPSSFKKAVFSLQAGMLEHFMPVSPPAKLQKRLEANGMENVPSAMASYSEGKLTVFNTQENIERLHGILRDMRRSLTGSLLFKFRTIEAPAARLRDLVHRHANGGHHAALWTALEPMIERSEATTIDTAWIATDPNIRGRHESGREISSISEFSTSKGGAAAVEFETRTVGSVVEVEAFVPSVEDFVQINLSHELQTTPPVTTRQELRLPDSTNPVDFPLLDLHLAGTSQGFAINPGSIRLVSLHRPVGKEKDDVLWATFVTCERHDRVPVDQETPAAISSDSGRPQVVETRVFQAPNGFFTGGWGPITPIMAEETLRQAGIDLPTDADVKVSNDSMIVRVKSNRETLDAIGALFRKAHEVRSSDIAVTAYIIETSAKMAREFEKAGLGQSDHSSLLQMLQTETKVGRAKHVATMRVETRDDVQATVDQTREFQQLVRIRPNEQGEIEFIMDERKSGHLFEVRPKVALGGDLITLDSSIEVSPYDAIQRIEHVIDAAGKRLEFPLTDLLRSHLRSIVTFRPGTTRLVWLYRPPESSADTVHAVFLNCSFVP